MTAGLESVIGRRATTLLNRRETQVREERRRDRISNRLTAARIRLAMQGAEMLCSLGRSDAFQSLIKAARRPILVWGGTHSASPNGDMSDVVWTYVNAIIMTDTALELHDYVDTVVGGRKAPPDEEDDVRITFLYDGSQPLWARLRSLKQIATADALKYSCSAQMLFEVLVQCAQPKKFRELILDALP